MALRLFIDINIPPTAPSAFVDVPVPQGAWRVVSLMALASSEGGLATKDVETTIGLNEVDQFRATESGAIEPLIVGGVMMRVLATKKVQIGAAFVRVIATLEQR